MIKLDLKDELKKYDFEQILNDSFIHADMNIDKPAPILRLNDEDNSLVDVLTEGNLSLIKGGSKSRKSFSITMLIHIILKQTAGDIIIFDTEQFNFHSLMNMKRLKKMSENYPRVKLYNLRKYKKDIRFDFVKDYIEKFSPRIAFIDNIRDIIPNFNDINQADEVVTALAQLSEIKGTHITNILHTNKGDNNARGHLGSELEQKSETVFLIQTENNVTTVDPAYTRNKSFEPIQFTIDEEGLPRESTDSYSDANTDPF